MALAPCHPSLTIDHIMLPEQTHQDASIERHPTLAQEGGQEPRDLLVHNQAQGPGTVIIDEGKPLPKSPDHPHELRALSWNVEGKSCLDDVQRDLPFWDVLLLQEVGGDLELGGGAGPAIQAPAKWRHCAVIVNRRWAEHIVEWTTGDVEPFPSVTLRSTMGLISFVSADLPHVRSPLGCTSADAESLSYFLSCLRGDMGATTTSSLEWSPTWISWARQLRNNYQTRP